MIGNQQQQPPPQRIAIVGGGISGIACSWTLRKHDSDVDIYEADDRLGGHANSVPFHGNGRTVAVDTGFVVLDEETYPQFTAFLRELDVETIPTDMSFGISANDGAFEWGSYSMQSFCHSFILLFTIWFWRFLFDIVRFSLFAKDILDEHESTSGPTEVEVQPSKIIPTSPQLESIGTYLARHKYSKQFIEYFLIPMVAAPWCIDPDEFARTFPAKPLIKFMLAHRMLDTVTTSLKYRAFQTGTKTYVDAFQKQLPGRHRLHLKTKIEGVTQLDKGARIKFANGSHREFDHVVLAIHANQALHLLGDGATDAQRRVLNGFTTSRNVCYLHSDTSLLPKRPSARVAWNCVLDQQPVARPTQSYSAPDHHQARPTHTGSKISITFDMNKLQDIPIPGEPRSPGRVLVTMNPTRAPRASQSIQVYYHPLITSESIFMSRHLDKINGVRHVSFAGAWMGFGFHEDGFAAGSHVAKMLIEGREKTGTLNLMGRLDDMVHSEVGYWRHILKLGVLAVQTLIEDIFTK